MPEPVFMALFFGCILSVPVAAFSVAALYRRAGFGRGWVLGLHAIGAVAILGDIAFFGGFSGRGGGGNGPAGVSTIFITAILVTSAALGLAFRKWPKDAPENSEY